MAAVAATADIMIEKNSEIIVRVEEALADLIVVSYCTDDKKFQGVLLDANKGSVLILNLVVYNIDSSLKFVVFTCYLLVLFQHLAFWSVQPPPCI